MVKIRVICFLFFLFFATKTFGQIDTNEFKQPNVIDNKTIIIKDSLTAIKVAEPILFSFYGKYIIKKERPYKARFIDNNWVIGGTMKKNYNGGVFLIVIDSRDGRIIKMTHGR